MANNYLELEDIMKQSPYALSLSELQKHVKVMFSSMTKWQKTQGWQELFDMKFDFYFSPLKAKDVRIELSKILPFNWSGFGKAVGKASGALIIGGLTGLGLYKAHMSILRKQVQTNGRYFDNVETFTKPKSKPRSK